LYGAQKSGERFRVNGAALFCGHPVDKANQFTTRRRSSVFCPTVAARLGFQSAAQVVMIRNPINNRIRFVSVAFLLLLLLLLRLLFS